MRSLVGIGLIAAGMLLQGPAGAQETEALRKELEEMRQAVRGDEGGLRDARSIS